MRFYKKIVIFGFVGLLTIFAACSDAFPSEGGEAGITPTTEGSPYTEATPYTPKATDATMVRIGFPDAGQTAAHIDEIEAEMNRLLEEGGSPVRAELVSTRNGSFGDLRNDLALLEKQLGRFDLLVTGADFIEAGFALDITEYLVAYPDLLAMQDEKVWRASLREGRNLCFPLERSLSGINTVHLLQVEPFVLSALDVAFPRTYEEMVSILREAKQRQLPYKLMVSETAPPLTLHRTYDEWPFLVDSDSLFIYYADGSMEPYIDSEVFQRDAALLSELDAEGLIYWVPEGEYPPNDRTGLDIAMGMRNDGYLSIYGNEVVPSGYLEPEKPSFRVIPIATGGLCVTANCKDPEAAVAMIHAIFTSDEMVRLLTFGLEGEDWNFREDGTFESFSTYTMRGDFYNHPNLYPNMNAEQLAQLQLEAVEDLVFSGFLRYTSGGFRNGDPPQEPMTEALRELYELRRGALSMSELDIVRQGMDAAGLQTLYGQTRQRYEEFLAQ